MFRRALLFLLVGCSSSQSMPPATDAPSTPDAATDAPTVVAVTPAADTQGNLAKSTTVTATLSTAIDCAAVTNDNLQVTRAGVRVPGTVMCTGSTLTFTPTTSLPTRVQLSATISNLKAADGTPFAAPFNWAWGMAGWTQNFGTAEQDTFVASAIDSANNIYVAGYTIGAFLGNTSVGQYDSYLVKVSPTGNVVWVRQIGSTVDDIALAVAVDPNDNVYIGGLTSGALTGTSAGGADAWLAKYNAGGTQQWLRQLGSNGHDRFEAIAATATDVYVTGLSTGNFDGGTNAGDFDVITAKFDAAGTKQWSRQIGSNFLDGAYSIKVDASGNAYVGGIAFGAFDGHTAAGSGDALVLKYDSAGTKQWSKQIGTTKTDTAWVVGFDASNNICVTGSTGASLFGTNPNPEPDNPLRDVIVFKLDPTGAQVWARQYGTGNEETGSAGFVDAQGNIYVTGSSYGDMDSGNPHQGNGDVQLTKYDSAGTQQWIRQIGTPMVDIGIAIVGDSAGDVFVIGASAGDIDGSSNAGGDDVFVAKYSATGTLQ